MQGRENHVGHVEQHLTGRVRDRAGGRDQGRVFVRDDHVGENGRGQRPEKPDPAAAGRYETCRFVQGQTRGQIEQGRMPREGMQIRAEFLGQGEAREQAFTRGGDPQRLAAVPAPADPDQSMVFRNLKRLHGVAQGVEIQWGRRRLRGAHGSAYSCPPGLPVPVLQLHAPGVVRAVQHQGGLVAASQTDGPKPGELVDGQRGTPDRRADEADHGHADQRGHAAEQMFRHRPEIVAFQIQRECMTCGRAYRLGQETGCESGPERTARERRRGQMHPVQWAVVRPEQPLSAQKFLGGQGSLVPRGQPRADHAALQGPADPHRLRHRIKSFNEFPPGRGADRDPHVKMLAPGHERGRDGVQRPVPVPGHGLAEQTAVGCKLRLAAR